MPWSKRGPFRKVTPEIFQRVLKCLLQRVAPGFSSTQLTLIVGTQGEFLTSSRDFYAAFMGQEELKVEYQGESIGKIPPDRVPPEGRKLTVRRPTLGGDGRDPGRTDRCRPSLE
jgi:hypothetical protein